MIKELLKLKEEELLEAESIGDEVINIIVNGDDQSDVNTLMEKLNSLADKHNNYNIIKPYALLYNILKESEKRAVTAVEATAFHYILMNPKDTDLDKELLVTTLYTGNKMTTKLTRCYFYWGGCVAMRINNMRRAIFFFKNCVKTPSEPKKISALGLEAASKLLILQPLYDLNINVGLYLNFVPHFIQSIAKDCRNGNYIGIKSTISNFRESIDKTGNLELVQYVCEKCKINLLYKYSKIYSHIPIETIKRKTSISEEDIKKLINECREEKGKDWVVTEDGIVEFGQNDRIELVDKLDQLKFCQEIVQSNDDHIDIMETERNRKMKEDK